MNLVDYTTILVVFSTFEFNPSTMLPNQYNQSNVFKDYSKPSKNYKNLATTCHTLNFSLLCQTSSHFSCSNYLGINRNHQMVHNVLLWWFSIYWYVFIYHST